MDTHQTNPTNDDQTTAQTNSDVQLLEDTNLSPQPTVQDGAADVIMNMESMIKNHMLQIDQLTIELKKHSDMLNDVLANESSYQQEVEKVKEANKQKNAIKQQILNRPENADLQAKVKGMKGSLNELKEAMSDYIAEYARLSGMNEIEGYDGEMREIVYVAKLIRANSGSK